MEKTIKIKELGKEYEIRTHDSGKRLKDIKIPKGWKLWDYDDCIKLHNNLKWRKQLNLENCWFFIEQPFIFNKRREYVARFDADSDRAFLSCLRYPLLSSAELGVRFCRSLKR